LRAAIKRGFDENMVAQLDDVAHSNLTDAQKIAVKLAEAFLTDPATFGQEDRAELRRNFDDEQVAELLLDLVRFRPGSKLAVASGTLPEGDELILI
jgi:alkylhydroperoxidase family enzyme